MHKAAALARLAAPALVLTLLATGCSRAGAEAGSPPVQPVAAAVPGQPQAAGMAGSNRSLRVSSAVDRQTFRDPATGRLELVEPDIRSTAVLIGDSQSEGAAGVPGTSTWPRTALRQVGYKVVFAGRGGTGYVAANGTVGNYADALERGNWMVPFGNPPLVVIEGGGNDAARGATDAQIVANADRLLRDLRQSYPKARFAMVGTLARGSYAGGGRRSEVDALLQSYAQARHIPFVSAGDWLTRYDAVNDLADGVHLKLSGHEKLAGVLASRLAGLGLTAADLKAAPASK
ncbi:SGNH/GDSL hydrolase family protein [Paenarthrobacter sp. DKR-5]|uniref:SGNH/GDSL hydrolase family protein n=1 Tax=Paenarthrobacter sp. DKR-5 TaxID=2835535 RepID=UPI001BDCAB8D|nr:SGNH/GDSL hydrolase family protein [Paenarthrobacter sp. DKR-5]MBT1002888.1 SGNH/GDSL hydrolase family protein [Paenarthrobacter sp. DKR-5]